MSAHPAVPARRPDHDAALRRVAFEFVTHYNNRDTHRVVSLFTDDGTTMPPFRPSAQGHGELRRCYDQLFAQFDPRNLKIEITHVEFDDNTAFEHGTYR